MQPTVSIARRVAGTHPEATLPCPVCAASLKARNLERHLGEVHELVALADAPFPASLELSGEDRRVVWLLLVLPLLWALGVAALALLGLTIDGGPVPIALALLLLAALALIALADFGYLRARLVLDEKRVELCYAFGLLRREVALPAAMETGSVWRKQQKAMAATYEHSVSEDVKVGGYLRLESAGTAVTIASRGGLALGKHWSASFRAGPKRRRWDITLDRVAHVALQYHLASLGLLRPA
jgi:hypothetical protein